MGVPGISANELRAIAVSPAAKAPSSGAPDQTPKEAAPAAQQKSAIQGETQPPARETFSKASGVRLHVDAETHRIIAQIVDENDNVVRQIPPEESLRIAKMSRQLQGLLFDQEA